MYQREKTTRINTDYYIGFCLHVCVVQNNPRFLLLQNAPGNTGAQLGFPTEFCRCLTRRNTTGPLFAKCSMVLEYSPSITTDMAQ